jgi:purine nucleosidase
MPATPFRPVYLDCDTGVDDAVALAYLLASPEIQLVGIGTVSGNTSASQAAENTLRLLALAGRTDIPVAVGSHDHLADPYGGGVPHIHGDNGIGNVELPETDAKPVAESAAELLLQLSRKYAGELEVITIGPTTNIALAIRLDQGLPQRVKQVTVMGGVALAPGNVGPVSEANIHNDPEAASVLISAPWPVTLVPLDVTLENVLEEEHQDALFDAEHPLTRAVGEILEHYLDFYIGTYGHRACALHDPLAAAIAVGTITATNAPAVNVLVDTTDGPGRGQTICDLRGQRLGPVDTDDATARVVLDTDRPLAEHLVERLTAPGAYAR